MDATENLVELAKQFELDRPHLRSVAFQLLGSVPDAEDAVQSAWVKASRSDFGTVQNLTGWLATVTAHEAVDQLRARKRRSERPLTESDETDRIASAGADEQALLADSVSRALLVVLDQLSPAQRIAFVLHDTFALPFETIGQLLDRSPAAAKKLASRARARLRPDNATRTPRTAEHIKIVEAFLAASRGGDMDALVNLLAPDVVRTVDRTLVPADVPTELRGAREVAEETRRFTQRARVGAVVLIAGVPGIAIAPAGQVWALLRISFGDDNRIRAIDIVGDPQRLRNVVYALPQWSFQQDHRAVD